MDIEKKLEEVAAFFKEEPANVHAEYERVLAKKRGEKHARADLVEQYAMEEVLAAMQQKSDSISGFYSGIFLATDGRFNAWAQYTYEKVKRLADAMPKAEAIAKRLINSRGQYLNPPDRKFDGGKPIDPNYCYFDVFGIVKEGKELKPMRFRSFDAALLDEIRLGERVQFYASKRVQMGTMSRMDASTVYLNAEPNTNFIYKPSVPEEEDDIMRKAALQFPKYAPKEIPKLITPELDRNGKEVIDETGQVKMHLDKRVWLFENLVVSFVHKNSATKETMYEFVHPDLVGWTIIVTYEPVSRSYDLVRYARANVCARMRAYDPENKRIIMDGLGYWQERQFRLNAPTEKLEAGAVKIIHED